MRLLAANIEELFVSLEREDIDDIVPRGPQHLRPYSLPRPQDPRDWAGVEGHWRRAVGFLDVRASSDPTW